MPTPCAPYGATLACLGVLLCAACASPSEHRAAIAAAPAAWAVELDEDAHEEFLEHVHELGQQSPADPDSLVSIITLLRQARPGGNPSVLARTECLRAAWRLARDLPAEELRADALTAAEFSERSTHFEQLLLDPTQAGAPELLDLARFLGSYRVPPGSEDLALDLAELVVTRGLPHRDGPGRAIFADLAPGCTRHALVLVTLRMADDSHPLVRAEALRACRFMHPGPGLDLVAGALGIESDRQVLLTALDSLESLAPVLDAPSVLSVLALVPQSADLSVRRRAQLLREALDP